MNCSASRLSGSRRAEAKDAAQDFYATMHVTRVDEWFVEAETAQEARDLLSGAGHRCGIGGSIHAVAQIAE
jgi:hypothetical protein